MMEHGTFDSKEFRNLRALKFEGMQNKNSRTFRNLVRNGHQYCKLEFKVDEIEYLVFH